MFAVQDIVFQLQRLVSAMAKYHTDCHGILKEADVFPIEVDLSQSTFTYQQNIFHDGEDDEEEEEEAEEALPEAKADVTSGDLIGGLE